MLCLLAVHLSEINKLLECKNIKKNIFSFNKVLIKEGVYYLAEQDKRFLAKDSLVLMEMVSSESSFRIKLYV